MAFPNLSLTYVGVKEILDADPFGVASFARAVLPNTRDGFSFAVHTGLIDLRNPPTCTCGIQKILSVRELCKDNESQGFYWVCGHQPDLQRCRLSTSITTNILFEKCRIPLATALELCLQWFFKVPVSLAAGQVGVSKITAVDWYSSCREICFEIVSRENNCIGGEGLHVEIDESHLFKRKYQRGRRLVHEHVWVFGGICRETKECFVTLVPNRTGATLWPIINERIAEGSIIISDSARVYNNLHFPDRGGFVHHQVNHRYNFVHPLDRNVYTNTIERQWGLLKGMVKGHVEDDAVDMYLGEYMYRRKYLDVTTDRERRTLGKQFYTFLNHAKKVFPGPYRN